MRELVLCNDEGRCRGASSLQMQLLKLISGAMRRYAHCSPTVQQRCDIMVRCLLLASLLLYQYLQATLFGNPGAQIRSGRDCAGRNTSEATSAID